MQALLCLQLAVAAPPPLFRAPPLTRGTRIEGLEPVTDTSHMPPLYRSPPALGWNDWNEIARKYPPWHPSGVNETIVLQQAAALAKLHGAYRYVNLDCGWSTGKRSAAGKLQLDREKYPSGLPALSQKLRGMGLALGIYTSGRMCCGIGSDGHPGGDGSEGHEAVDVATFEQWGVEYIKDDDCGSSPGHFSKMAAAIEVSYAGKPVVYSIHSPWTHKPTNSTRPSPFDAAGFASSWRTTNDITDDWAAVLDRSATNDEYAALNVPGHHNDPDMLECNNSLTDVESASHFALWAVMKAPLLVGTDLTAASEATLATLGNAGVLALSQDTLGQQARRLVSAEEYQVWGGQLSADGYVLMLLDAARGALPLSVNVTLPAAVKGSYAVTDVWSGKALPDTKAGAGKYLLAVTERHGNALVRLAPKQQ